MRAVPHGDSNLAHCGSSHGRGMSQTASSHLSRTKATGTHEPSGLEDGKVIENTTTPEPIMSKNKQTRIKATTADDARSVVAKNCVEGRICILHHKEREGRNSK
jgi:hypothetical protein